MPPAAEEVLPTPEVTPLPLEIPDGLPETLTVTEFQFSGNTAFRDEELADALQLADLLEQPTALTRLLQVAADAAKVYAEAGYGTSGATLFVPEKTQQRGRGPVEVQIIEGQLSQIRVAPPERSKPGYARLNSGYLRSRLKLAAGKPLNLNRLQEALQLLQLDPLIDSVQARLSTGASPGETILDVTYTPARSFDPELSLDNGRAPSVGSLQRRVTLQESSLLGLGDGISVGYTNSDGSNRLDLSYELPVNARDGSVRFSYGRTKSNVIEPPFDVLDIESGSLYYELSYRQPILRQIRGQTFQEVALGLTASRQETETTLLDIPFPLSAGADEDGRIRVSALRFFQEWTRQDAKQVFAVRSQFNLGLDAFDSTINDPIPGIDEEIPDSRFFSWQGQAQWVRSLGPDALFLMRSNLQLSDRALLSLEQFAAGGFRSVRGYRQDALVADNGLLASIEFWIPLLRIPKERAALQLIPFFDYGRGWNNGRADPDPNTLASVGLGLQWRHGDTFTARFDWGIPLMDVESRDRTLQERGFYFSVQLNPF